MPTHSGKRSPLATRRRALELLAASRDGYTEASLLAHGFKIEMLADMISAGLATAKIERMVAGKQPIEVVRVRITEPGRRALRGHRPARPRR
jgi:hypothetical protein